MVNSSRVQRACDWD